MGQPSAETTPDTKARLDLVKQVLQEMNQEEPKPGHDGVPIPTATQRWGPLAAWVIYCSGSGAENEHLALLELPPENGRERGYIFTPNKTLLIAHPGDHSFEKDRTLFDFSTSKLGDYTLLGGLVDSLAYAVTEGTHLSRARIAFNWCREDPRHDTMGYATLDYLRRAMVQRYDSGLVVVEGPPDPKDPHYGTKPTHRIKEDTHPGLWRPFYGFAEFHWENRFPSAYPIIKRLEELTRAGTQP